MKRVLFMCEHLDSTARGFTPFWTRCSLEELDFRIARLRRAMPYCRGRASDLRQHVALEVARLGNVRNQRFGSYSE